MPLLAPVTITLRPVMSGIGVLLEVVMGNNVVPGSRASAPSCAARSRPPARTSPHGALEPGEPERVGLVLFATIQGIAALVTGGMVDAGQLDELLGDAVAHFLRGSRIAA